MSGKLTVRAQKLAAARTAYGAERPIYARLRSFLHGAPLGQHRWTTQAEISWSTDVVEPGTRLEAWRTFLVDAFQECDMEYEANGDFWAQDDLQPLRRDQHRQDLRAPGARPSRTAEKAKFAEDGVVMTHRLRGPLRLQPGAARHTSSSPAKPISSTIACPAPSRPTRAADYWLISLPAKVDHSRLRRFQLADRLPHHQRQAGAASCSPPISTPSTRRPACAIPRPRRSSAAR